MLRNVSNRECEDNVPDREERPVRDSLSQTIELFPDRLGKL
jgi:hypothetical protein